LSVWPLTEKNPPSELADYFNISRQAVLKHLNALKTAGLVQGRKEGKPFYYSPDPQGLATIALWIEKFSMPTSHVSRM
jgi:predicted transcriptional regulator